MSYIKRAMLSISRRKGKSLILFAIIFILGNLIAGAISIQQSTKQVETATKEKLGSSAKIDFDYSKMMNSSEGSSESEEDMFKPLDIDLIKSIGKKDAVKYYDYNAITNLGEGTTKSYKVSKDDSLNIMPFKLLGVQYAPVMDFVEKKNKLTDGRVFTDEDIKQGNPVGIISKQLAEENNLQVGDTFTLKNNVYTGNMISNESEPTSSRDVVLEVIGIYEQVEYEKSDSKDKTGMDAFIKTEQLNTVYTPNAVVEEELKFAYDESLKVDPDTLSMEKMYTPTYVLKSPDLLKNFEKEVKPLLPKRFKLTTTTDQYDKIAGPIKSIGSISQIVLIASISASLIIISLIVILFLRDRKHEFGIYLSLGEKKRKVLSQVVLEVVMIAFIGITISLFTGNFLAKGVSQTLMESQLKQSEQDSQSMQWDYEDMMNPPKMSSEEVVKDYQVSIDMTYILIFYVIGLGTVIVSTLAPMVYITRLNPKKVLL